MQYTDESLCKLNPMGFYSSSRTEQPDEALELDLTNSHLPHLDEVEIRDTLEVCIFLSKAFH